MDQRAAEARKQLITDNARQAKEQEEAKAEEQVKKTPENNQEQVIEQKKAEGAQTEGKKLNFTDDELFPFLSEKLGRSVGSFDDLNLTQDKIVEKEIEKIVEKEAELTPDVAAYKKYNEETGRGIFDFAKTQDDWTNVSDDYKAREYLRSKHKKLSESQIDSMIKRKYKPDPEIAEADEIEQADIDYAILIEEAEAWHEDQRSKYLIPKEVEKKDVAADVNKQRDLETQAWTDGVSNASKAISEFSVDDFKYDLKGLNVDNYKTPDSFMNQFVGEDGNVNFKELIEVIEIGKAVKNGSFISSYSDSLKAKWLEEQHRDLNNHGDQKEIHETSKEKDIQVDATTSYLNDYVQSRMNRRR